jgi:hypothetical protein
MRMLAPIAILGLTAIACTWVTAQALPATAPGSSGSLADGYRRAKWQQGVTVTFQDACTMVYTSTGAPSHGYAPYYLVPDGSGPIVATTPTGRLKLRVGFAQQSTATRSYTFNICPTVAASAIPNTLGAIGWTIGGAALFNPFEANGQIVAGADNVSYRFTDGKGVVQTASFMDACGGHQTPGPVRRYHYHGWSACLTAAAGDADGPSHIIAIALDGYPVYGDKDMNGNTVEVSELDACNGIVSPTPEFPEGVYHYVLPSMAMQTVRSAPTCYHGLVPPQLLTQDRPKP